MGTFSNCMLLKFVKNYSALTKELEYLETGWSKNLPWVGCALLILEVGLNPLEEEVAKTDLFYTNFTKTQFEKAPILYLHTLDVSSKWKYAVRLNLTWLTQNLVFMIFSQSQK